MPVEFNGAELFFQDQEQPILIKELAKSRLMGFSPMPVFNYRQ